MNVVKRQGRLAAILAASQKAPNRDDSVKAIAAPTHTAKPGIVMRLPR